MKSHCLHFIKQEWLQLLLLAIPLVAALAAMPFASERVPMQWNLRGEVNWYAPKSWGLLVTPVSMLPIYALLLWLESRDPARHRETDGGLTAHGKVTRMIRLAISFVMAALLLVQIAWALGHRPDVSRWVISGTALLCAFMGNLFGKLKPNRYAGIRVPWTMKSEHVWRQTHRIAGWVWTSSSLIMAALSWLLPLHVLEPVTGTLWLLLLIVVPLIVAWREARLEKQRSALSHGST